MPFGKKASVKDMKKLTKQFDDIEKAVKLVDRYGSTGIGSKRDYTIVKASLKQLGKDRAAMIKALK